jgi:NAD(P)-dependent dehydrogenase (short-subunit alcohol dehydrogenase family)
VDTKNAVVTGAASGIGKECAKVLLAAGWNVYGLDVSDTSPQMPRSGSADSKWTPVQCDVTSSSSVSRAFSRVADETDSVNALICCAGILRVASLETMSEETFDAVFGVNVKGPWLCAKSAMPLLERGAASGYPSRIIFVSSTAALRPKVGAGAYSASKAALGNLTRSFAAEVASRRILVNAVAPGAVDTPLWETYVPATGSGYKPAGVSPVGRIAQPSDIVSVMMFLLSSGAEYVAGAIIPVDAGTSAARA